VPAPNSSAAATARRTQARPAVARRATATAPPTGAQATDTSTVGGLADEGSGWHFGELPIVFAVVIALGALGALYGRVVRLFSGASRWLIVVPMWAAGLLVLFKVLGLLLPADL
jgi:hypothetical protein